MLIFVKIFVIYIKTLDKNFIYLEIYMNFWETSTSNYFKIPTME
jgi:hypothetical protein